MIVIMKPGATKDQVRHVIELIRRSLKGECFVSIDDAFEKVDSWHHGHVDAVLSATLWRLTYSWKVGRCIATKPRPLHLVGG